LGYLMRHKCQSRVAAAQSHATPLKIMSDAVACARLYDERAFNNSSFTRTRWIM